MASARASQSILAKITTSLAAGNTRENAARTAGISTETLEKWLAEGKRELVDAEAKSRFFEEHHDPRAAMVLEGLPPHALFYQSVREIEAKGESSVLERLLKSNKGEDLRWYLERRFPKTWGRRALEVTGRDGGPIEVKDARESLLSKLLANTAAGEAPDGDQEPEPG